MNSSTRYSAILSDGVRDVVLGQLILSAQGILTSGMERTAEVGSSVLLDINGGDRITFARLYSSATLKIGNAKCSLAPLIGNPFGATFELRTGRSGSFLIRISPNAIDGNGQELDDAEHPEELQDRDNRSLVDSNTAQSLSAEDIDRMRRDGVSGKQIVDALVANSTSFENKTAFSQEKYKRKKQKKYAPWIIMRRPCARSVCEAYFIKDPRKIGFCRMDMLALMLSLGNVGANADILVLDMLGGLITAAVAERMRGHGSLCSTFYNSKRQTIDMVRLLNLDASTCSSVTRASLATLITARESNSPYCLSEISKIVAGVEVESNDALKELAKEDGNQTEQAQGTIVMNSLGGIQNPATITMEDACLEVPQQAQGTIAMNSLGGIQNPVTITMEDACLEVPQAQCTISMNSLDGIQNPATITMEDACLEAPIVGITVGNDMEINEENKSKILEMEYKSEDNVHQASVKSFLNSNGTISSESASKAKAGNDASSEQVTRWGRQGFTSLIVAAPELDPWTIAQQVLPLLTSSGSFVFYHPYVQPLAECMSHIQRNNLAIALQLSEPWCREYQVLPSRTHPHMQMSSTGGYVLSGIKIVS